MKPEDFLNAIHICFCKKLHCTDMSDCLERSDDYCYFYVEDSLTEDQQLDRKYWTQFAVDFVHVVQSYELDIDDTLKKFLLLSCFYYDVISNKQELLEYLQLIVN